MAGPDDFSSLNPTSPNPMAMRFSSMLANNPTLKQTPGVATALASANALPEAMDTTAALTKGLGLRNVLDAAGDDNAELRLWNAMPKSDQELALKSGYQPIIEKKQSGWRGALNKVFHGAARGVDAIVPDQVGNVAHDMSHGALEGWQWANEEKNRVFRTGALEAISLMHGDAVGLPSAWRDTADGDRSFDPYVLGDVQKRFDPEVFDLAKRAAMHEDIRGQIASLIEAGQPDKAADLERQMDSKVFNDALSQINAAKLSPGRMLGTGLGIEEHHKLFKTISGTMDGVWTWMTDPIIVAGQGIRAVRTMKYALKPFHDAAHMERHVDELFTNPAVRRYWDDLGPHLTAIRSAPADRAIAGKSVTEIKRNYKAAVPMLDSLVKAGVHDADSAHAYFKNATGYTSLLNGQAAFRRPLMPYRTNLRAQAQKFKPSQIVDFTAPASLRLISDQDFKLTGDKAFHTKQGSKKLAGEIRAENETWRGRARTLFSRFTTKLPEVKNNQLLLAGEGSERSAEDIERIARMVGPKYWARQVHGAFLAADVEGRRQIAKGVYSTIIEASGIAKASPEGARWAKQFLKAFDTEGGAHYASLKGLDKSPLSDRRMALFPEDARPWLAVPSFREFYAQSAKMGLMSHAGHHVTREGYDWYTQSVFKPSVLLRPALAFRNGLEEVTNHIVREGGQDYLLGRASMKYLEGQTFRNRKAVEDALIENRKQQGLLANAGTTRGARKLEQEERKLRAVLDATPGSFDPEAGRLFRMVAKPVVKLAQAPALVGLRPMLAPESWQTGYDMYRAHLMGKLGEAYLSKMNHEALRHLNELSKDPWAVRRFNEEILENSRVATRGSVDDPNVIAMTPGKFGKMMKARMASTGDYKLRAVDSEAGLHAWGERIHKVADTRSGALAFEHIDDERAGIDAIVADMRAHPQEYDTDLIRDLRRHHGHDPGNEEFARRVYAEARHIVSDRDGNLILPLVEKLLPAAPVTGIRSLAPHEVDVDFLRGIDETLHPRGVLGRDTLMIREMANPINELVTNGFKTIGDMTSWISRQPIFAAHYLRARENLGGWEHMLVEAGHKPEVAAEMTSRKAVEEAIQGTLKYVDNPIVRSQASELMRNVFPFWRAQEEFYVRWARTFKYAPESIAYAAHLLDGAQASGFVKEDDQGHRYFVYPMTGFTYQAVAKTMGALNLPVLQVPVANMFTGRVQFLNAGLDPRGVYPSAGPMVSFPLQFAREITGSPDLEKIEGKLLGQQAAGRDAFLSQLPTPVRRAIQAFADDKEQAAVVKQAMAYLEYANQGLPDDATPAMREAYLDNLKRWSKGILAMKVIYGMAAPTPFESQGIAPKSDPDAQRLGLQTVRDEFRDLVNRVGFEDAIGYWIKEHPDLLPFTVSSTKATAGGAVVPATELAGQFIDANKAMFESHPKASAYFLPQAGGTFDHKVYGAEMDMGLRRNKTMEEFYSDVKMAGDLDFYYSQQRTHEDAADQLRAQGAPLTSENEGWSTWRDDYMKLHPLVADYLSQGAVRQRDRESTMTDLRNLLDSDLAPQGETADLFRRILQGYDAHRMFQDNNQGRSDAATAARKAEARGFDDWLQREVAGNPSGQMLYAKLLKYADEG